MPTFDSSSQRTRIDCVFATLSWLVKHERANRWSQRLTNYIVLINLSTRPMSVWVMFDYHMRSEIDDAVRFTNRLGNYTHELASQEAPTPTKLLFSLEYELSQKLYPSLRRFCDRMTSSLVKARGEKY